MFKKILILFFCAFFSLNNQAQEFGGGIILGLSTSQVGGDNLAGFYKAGLLIGVFANKSISELLIFQMEMSYIQKGSNNPDMNDYDHANYSKQDISSSYIEVPLLLQYHQNNKLNVEAGIQAAYLIDAYYNDLYGKMSNDISPFTSYDIGLLLGFNYKYTEHISLNTRISNSILPIGAEDYQNQVGYNSYRKGKYNTVLSFALHYNF